MTRQQEEVTPDMITVELHLMPEMLGAVQWLVERQDSTTQHVMLALLMNGLVIVERELENDDFETRMDQARIAFKRYIRANAPEIWNAMRRY